MNQDHITLEFPQIIAQMQELAVSQTARDELAQLAPSMEEAVCRSRMEATTAARRVLDAAGSPPLAIMDGLEESVSESVMGGMLTPEQLAGVMSFAVSCRRMEAYLSGVAGQSAGIAAYRMELPDLSDLCRDIEASVREDKVLDEASSLLRDLRRRHENLETAIRDKLNRILQSRKQYLADSYITTRAGRYVVPVQRKFQSAFGGTAVDVSAKGTTVFMEPSSIVPLRQELDSVALMADEEERRVLYALSDRVAEAETEIRRGMRLMTELDALFAKAKLSQQMDAREVELTGERRILLRNARHPLLNREKAVPLNFIVEDATTGVVITGPNTGGKTVCVKTVGLLCLMAQCGLHIPCGEGSVVALRDAFLCDIGDSQSITQNLSTFSGHMTNVIRILDRASRDSLVLLDELGSGTDPAEGMGIAVAVLGELRRRGCLFLVTTHYSQVKTWAETTPGVMAARMAFDRETLAPLYRLELGKSGESCALDIAKRLGLPECLIAGAREAAYGTPAGQEPAMKIPHSRLKRYVPRQEANPPSFAVGDSVSIAPNGVKGIVYRPADDQGEVIVQVQGKKLAVRHTRLTLLVSADRLYPEDYDFSIIFDTVANRKADHLMSRKFDAEALIIHQEGRITE
ncbi:MAG: DNA mismatch repair protein MutS [Clostridiales bacterium]|nr:DNA mismatch repair protein MutS [Clostridiales bacterium]